MAQQQPPFITGSRAYGRYVTPDSDLDVVVLTTPEQVSLLRETFGVPTRIGRLNLILESDPLRYEAWRVARIRCREAALDAEDFSKADAIRIHDAVREEFGITTDFETQSGEVACEARGDYRDTPRRHYYG